MAKGRKPTPESKRAATSRPVKRRVPRPTIPDGCPEPPLRLSKQRTTLAKRARALWLDFGPELHSLGILTALDRATFEDWCLTKAALEDSYRALGEEGFEVQGEKGAWKRSPAAQQVTALSTQLLRLSAELGLSPRSRGSLDVRPVEPATEAERREKSEFEKHAERRRAAIRRK